ncbi:sensor histidine kinase [Microbacterium halotolerans]|uniref:sensor histidine kinase n=1 Tax=Microbacterium halotolerans TaxID=246613 RepID=UPI0013C32769|nr:histidine kinase [Microbacterium halotolerans]
MEARIASAAAAPAAAGASGPGVRDVVLVVVATAVAVAETLVRPDLVWPVASLIVTLVVLPGLLWRRTHPLIVVAGMTAVSAGYEITGWAAGEQTSALGAVAVMLLVPYALFRWGSGFARMLGGALLALGVVVSLAASRGEWTGAAAAVVIVGGACLVGVIRRQRVEAHTAALERERSREREGLARDLHDTVAHHVSAIAIRAQAAQALPPDVERSTTAFGAIEREAREALTEMRSLVRVLRGDEASAPLQPIAGLAEIEALAAVGPPVVQVRAASAARVAVSQMPRMAQNALFRIAQEAVANARRHATGATRVVVELVVSAADVELRVTDDGSPASPGASGGYGITGMTERASMLGGRLHAGPGETGWIVSAVVPSARDEGSGAS